MGIFDKIKSLVGGNAAKVESGIDKAADMVKDKLPDEHDAKVDAVVDKAKDLIDGDDEADADA